MIAWWLLLILPIFIAIWQSFLGSSRVASGLNMVLHLILLAAAGFLLQQVIFHGAQFFGHQWFYLDRLSALIVLLTTFVALTTAIYSDTYLRYERFKNRFTRKHLKLYYSLYPVFVWSLLLATLSNNLGMLWVAMELATLSTVLLISLYRTPQSLEAAWKYFILCGVGIAQALLGTILLYFAAQKVLSTHANALNWSTLYQVKQFMDPHLLKLAFVFFLVGYGTKVGLVPLHNWLPDAHAEGPTPFSAALSGLLLNVALYAVLRGKIIVDGAVGNLFTSHLLMVFGLLSVFVAVFSLYRQQDVKRFFSYSSIEHMGLMTFAFGLGGPIATLAGLLHLILHSLTKSSIFFSVGLMAQQCGSQLITKIRGLIYIAPMLGIGFLLGVIAICGLPPFGLFVSEFLILYASYQYSWWLMACLLILLLVAFAIMLKNMQHMLFAAEPGQQIKLNRIKTKTGIGEFFPMYLHLAMVFMLVFFVPVFFLNWLEQVVQLLTG